MADEPAKLTSITVLHQPNPALVAELEQLLEQAKAGQLRGMLYVAWRPGCDVSRFGNAGAYSLADFALGLKLMELELDSIVTHAGEPEAGPG
jgi:hypothetical protein